jgi:hypothetical protein
MTTPLSAAELDTEIVEFLPAREVMWTCHPYKSECHSYKGEESSQTSHSNNGNFNGNGNTGNGNGNGNGSEGFNGNFDGNSLISVNNSGGIWL